MILFLLSNIASADIGKMIDKHSAKYGIDKYVIMGIAFVESTTCRPTKFKLKCLNPKALSSKGAMGIMQLLPSTARDMGFKGHDTDLYNPYINIKYGTKYLKMLYKRYNNLYMALDAYYRGMGRIEKKPYRGNWMEHTYVGRVMEYAFILREQEKYYEPSQD